MTESPSLLMKSWLGRTSLVLAIILVAVGLAVGDAGTTSLAQENVSFEKSFTPDTIGPGSATTLRFDIVNHDPVNPIFDMTFTDQLPTGVEIASTANASLRTCS